MKALVTGGHGFIGHHLVRDLIAHDWAITVLDDRPPGIELERLPYKVISRQPDEAWDSRTLRNALQGTDVCFHLASATGPATSNKRIPYDIAANLLRTIALLDAMRDTGTAKIIYPSSGGTVYGNSAAAPFCETMSGTPISSYGIIKQTIENYIQLYHRLYSIEYQILRVANPYGPGQKLLGTQGVIGNFIGKIITGDTLEIFGTGEVVRDYIYISDVISAIRISATANLNSDIFNVGSGKGRSLQEIIQILKAVSDRPFSFRFSPARQMDCAFSVLDITKAKTLLGWTPETDIVNGIRNTFQWATGSGNHIA